MYLSHYVEHPQALSQLTCQPCLAKTVHSSCSIVSVIPKEDLGGTSPAKPSFGMTPTIELYSVVFTGYILESVSYQKKAWLGWCHANLLLV